MIGPRREETEQCELFACTFATLFSARYRMTDEGSMIIESRHPKSHYVRGTIMIRNRKEHGWVCVHVDSKVKYLLKCKVKGNIQGLFETRISRRAQKTPLTISCCFLVIKEKNSKTDVFCQNLLSLNIIIVYVRECIPMYVNVC